MTVTQQRQLAIEEEHEVSALVTIEMLCARFKRHRDVISNWIDEGRFNWVWDLGTGNRKIRELRVWARHYLTGQAAPDLTVDQVVNMVIGTKKERLHTAEVGIILAVADPTVLRLVRKGELLGPLVGHTQWITREGLAGFLNRRLLNK